MIEKQSKKEYKKSLFTIKLLNIPSIINPIISLSSMFPMLTFKIVKISTVSLVLKYSGAKIIRDPFERCKRFTNLIFLNSKTLSSFPKWKAATNRNIIRVNVENINQHDITNIAKTT